LALSETVPTKASTDGAFQEHRISVGAVRVDGVPAAQAVARLGGHDKFDAAKP